MCIHIKKDVTIKIAENSKNRHEDPSKRIRRAK